MTRLRIVAVTAAVIIALAAWGLPLEAGSGGRCPTDGVCAEKSPALGGSGNANRFFGGEGMERISKDDRPDARQRAGGEGVFRCGPDRHEASADAGGERVRSCDDVRARFY